MEMNNKSFAKLYNVNCDYITKSSEGTQISNPLRLPQAWDSLNYIIVFIVISKILSLKNINFQHFVIQILVYSLQLLYVFK